MKSFSLIIFQGSSVASAVKLYGDPDITWTSNGLLKLSPGVMRRLFLGTVDRIKQSVGNVLNNPAVKGMWTFYLTFRCLYLSSVKVDISACRKNAELKFLLAFLFRKS